MATGLPDADNGADEAIHRAVPAHPSLGRMRDLQGYGHVQSRLCGAKGTYGFWSGHGSGEDWQNAESLLGFFILKEC